MKEKIIKILSKTKIIIPVAVLLGIVAVVFLYNRVGKAPFVDLPVGEVSKIEKSGDIVKLSFLKPGKIKEVLVKEGDEVKKGQILAKLYSPDQEASLIQAKSNLDLAEAQFASLNNQYANTKKQQDLIVKNAYQTLLSSSLEGIPDDQTNGSITISGVYACGKEGSYYLKPYKSGDSDSGYSFQYSGLENGTASVKFQNAISFGNCGLNIKFDETNFDSDVEWTINIPNIKGSTYLVNKNAYELAKENRDKILDDLITNIGKNEGENSVARATVEVARGAYEVARGAYENNLIVSPVDGVINFVDSNLIFGQYTSAGKNVISIIKK